MLLSDVSVKRPVFASVLSLLLVAFGLIALQQISLREYPAIDPPVVSVETNYRGASAAVVESKITKLIESRISGIEGLKNISSSSRDGRSDITLEFREGFDVDNAANDVRDKISGMMDNLPIEADPPEIQKEDSNSETLMWLNLTSESMSNLDLSDYARRNLVDRLSVLPGVGRVRIGGGADYAMRIWLDRAKLASLDITVQEIESRLRQENVEMPAGVLNSELKDFTLRVSRGYLTEEDFKNLVIKRAPNGHLVRLGELARVELGPRDTRLMFRVNQEPVVGLGISKQSTANTLEVGKLVKQEVVYIQETLPAGMNLVVGFDNTVFIAQAIQEVFNTLLIAAVLVIAVIFIFLGDFRAMLIPAVTVPVSLISVIVVLYAFDFTLNLLTILAMALAIGLIVDDAIVVLENIHRRMQKGETPLVAAYKGARQVGFAVIATTLVLVAVFLPITFLPGDLGRIFGEFSSTLAGAVVFSSFIALTLTPVLCSKLLKRESGSNKMSTKIDKAFEKIQGLYRNALTGMMANRFVALVVVAATIGGAALLFKELPREFTPREDRGSMFMRIVAPEGASYDYLVPYVDQIESRLAPMLEEGVVTRLLFRAPGWGSGDAFNSAFGIINLADWSERPHIDQVRADIYKRIGDINGVRIMIFARQALRGGDSTPVQFVLGGPTYEDLAEWRNIVMTAAQDNPALVGLEHDYRDTKPQIRINIKRDIAADLGLSIQNISRTLEAYMGQRRVTSFVMAGEEYDVLFEGERSTKRDTVDIENLFVKSDTTGRSVPLSSVVDITYQADAQQLNRYNRVRALTFEADLGEGVSLGEALDVLENVALTELPAAASFDYKGLSYDYKYSGDSIALIFVLAIIVVYLVMAAQFESFRHPAIIMLTVPLAIAGGLLGLWLHGQTINLYSQIGLIMLVALATKNGILIVEFTNQMRDQGLAIDDAILQAAELRLRPILMTTITTVLGAVPLVASVGAGSESRAVIGTVILYGVGMSALLTLFVIPMAYRMMAGGSSSPLAVSKKLESELNLLAK